MDEISLKKAILTGARIGEHREMLREHARKIARRRSPRGSDAIIHLLAMQFYSSWCETLPIYTNITDLSEILKVSQAYVKTVKKILSQNPLKDTLATIWCHGENSYSIDGLIPFCVSKDLHAILQVFLNKELSLTTRVLQRKAGVNNAAKSMKKLVDFHDGLFAAAVRLPEGEKGDGYFVRVTSLKTK